MKLHVFRVRVLLGGRLHNFPRVLQDTYSYILNVKIGK